MDTHVFASMTIVCALLFATLFTTVRGDDMAFVEVSMSGAMDIRYLDFAVPAKAGIAGFFEESPMYQHDWIATTTLNTTGAAILKAMDIPSSTIRQKAQEVESRLEPMFLALPKDSDGRISSSSARYALHRYFKKQHGWSLKGLEPAGSSLYKGNYTDFAEEVKQVSKYVTPAYLLRLISLTMLEHENKSGGGVETVSLRGLVVLVLIFEQLIHTEMEEYLFSVFRTSQLPLGGILSDEEVDTVLSTFLLVYAFGSHLEVSTKHSLRDAASFLDENHQGWRALRKHLKEAKQSHTQPINNFGAMLSFLERYTNEYSSFQERDCRRAQELFTTVPRPSSGKAPLEDLRIAAAEQGPSAGRPLFREAPEDLQELGALDDSSNVLAANYLLSQALCISTASMYTVCCRTTCEDLLEAVEVAVGRPEGSSEEVAKALRQASPALKDLQTTELELAVGSVVPIHGRAFASFLHDRLPMECPLPEEAASKAPQLSPKTASEWMLPSDLDEEELVSVELYHDVALARFTTMGLKPGKREEKVEDRLLESFPIETIRPELTNDDISKVGSLRNSYAMSFLRFFCMGVVLLAACASLKGTLLEAFKASSFGRTAEKKDLMV
mmetsp:Transcript_44128/g.94615  ORF Transcript_44128/g.94615 Transcript_44128/m.94615 type:complete len:612 (+) Transcript_44128:239-2074(+)